MTDRAEFPGERPMTWVTPTDPLWRELSNRWVSKNPTSEVARRTGQPPVLWSKHVDPKHGPGWFFPTPWVAELELRNVQDLADGMRPFHSGEPVLPKMRGFFRDSAAAHTASGAEPWLPLKPSRRGETITAMAARFTSGKVNRHEYETYAGTLRATAALLGEDDPDSKSCLELAGRVEEQARLSDDAFVRRAWGWLGDDVAHKSAERLRRVAAEMAARQNEQRSEPDESA